MTRMPHRRKPRIPYEARNSNWRVNILGHTLFIYWKEELMPRYKFIKKEGQSWWQGHGYRDTSVKGIMDWVREQPKPN